MHSDIFQSRAASAFKNPLLIHFVKLTIQILLVIFEFFYDNKIIFDHFFFAIQNFFVCNSIPSLEYLSSF